MGRVLQMIIGTCCLLLVTAETHSTETHNRDTRSILGGWFGREDHPNVVTPKIINEHVPHYPIWKVHKYKGINLKPMPISVVRNTIQSPVYKPEVIVKTPVVLEPAEHKVIPISTKVQTATNSITDDIQSLMKLLDVTDAAQVPPIDEIMEMLGAKSHEEAIETVKEIASTEEGIGLIKSFLETRANPSEDEVEEEIKEEEEEEPEVVEEIVKEPAKVERKLEAPTEAFLAYSGIPTTLDRTHTNLQLAQTIVPPTNGIREVWRNFKQMITPLDNTKVPLTTLYARKPEAPGPQIVHVNHAIPITNIDLPNLPGLAPTPKLKGIPDYPAIPPLPQIQLPSHFNVPKNIVQGPYTRVKLPNSSIRHFPPLVYPQASLGTQITPLVFPKATYFPNRDIAPIIPSNPNFAKAELPPLIFPKKNYFYYDPETKQIKPNFEVKPEITPLVYPKTYQVTGQLAPPVFPSTHHSIPIYTITDPIVKTLPHGPQILKQVELSQSNFDAFKSAPKIVSSFPVPSLPYHFEEPIIVEEDPFVVAANSPVEAISVPVDDKKPAEEQPIEEIRRSGTETIRPQRLSGYNAFATGKVHRASNVDVLQIPLTAGNAVHQSVADKEDVTVQSDDDTAQIVDRISDLTMAASN